MFANDGDHSNMLICDAILPANRIIGLLVAGFLLNSLRPSDAYMRQ